MKKLKISDLEQLQAGGCALDVAVTIAIGGLLGLTGIGAVFIGAAIATSFSSNCGGGIY
jgi:hypothetical protein